MALFVQGNGCPIARNAVPVVNALAAEFEPQGVRFLGLNANPQDDRAAVAREVEEYGLRFPVLLDETQLVAEALGVTRTAEVLVIEPRSWRLLYRGPVDDRMHYEAQRPARNAWVREVLRAHLDGEPLEPVGRDSPGCLVSYPHRLGARPPISYGAEVAPILNARCRSCHRAGGVAPWAMRRFAAVQGWSAMIREVVRTRRMPPWHADEQHVGTFANGPDLVGSLHGIGAALKEWIGLLAYYVMDRTDELFPAPEADSLAQ